MRVYLTGGSGFFGRILAGKFLAAGHEVIAPGSKEVDLLNAADTRRAVKDAKPDLLVHSAAFYGGLGINMSDPDKLFYLNTLMIAHIYQAAADAGVPKVQGIGSSCAYPGHIDGDLKEEDFWEGELHPSVVAYGFSKRLQEIAQQVYSRKTGMKTQLPILTNLYGEYDTFQEYRGHVLSALIKRISDAKLNSDPYVINWGSGNPIREFLYVDDAAEACFRLAVSDIEGRMNVGTGIGTSIKDLAEKIALYVGYKGEIRWDISKPDGIYRKVNDISRMRETLRFTPPTDLDSGLRKTIKWYMENKETADQRI